MVVIQNGRLPKLFSLLLTEQNLVTQWKVATLLTLVDNLLPMVCVPPFLPLALAHSHPSSSIPACHGGFVKESPSIRC